MIRTSFPPTEPLPLPSRQQGMALLCVLIFLGLVTLWALMNMQGTQLQEKMSGNTAAEEAAFQAAEAARIEAQNWFIATVQSTGIPPATVSSGGRVWDSDIGVSGFSPMRMEIPEQWDHSRWAEKGTRVEALPAPANAYWGILALDHGLINVAGSPRKAHYYRIIARGALGTEENTQHAVMVHDNLRIICNLGNAGCKVQ